MRPEKRSIVEEIKSFLAESEYVILADYSGMKVKDFSALRGQLADADARLTVVKNSFLGVALGDAQREAMESLLQGRTAVITGTGDITAVAKALKQYSKDSKLLTLKGGSLNTQIMSADDVDALASVPSREVLYAQLVGTLQAPMTQVVGVMHSKVASLLYVLTAIEEKKKAAA